MMAAVVTFILGNIQLALIIVALVVAFLKLRRARASHSVMTPSYTVWGEMLFYTVGVGFAWFGLLHAFRPAFAAGHIGWHASPFQWELAWAELGVSVIGLMSLWRGYEMRLATTLVYAIFSFGAAAQHIHQIACCQNYAPGNAGPILWFGDIALPAFLLILAYVSRDADERTRRL